MFKNSFKKISAVVCAFAVAAQFAVMPVNAAYINEDHSLYKGEEYALEDISLSSSKTANTTFTMGLTGNYTVAMDVVFGGKHAAGSTDRNTNTATEFAFSDEGNGTYGGRCTVLTATDTGVTLQWKGGSHNSGSEQTPELKYGETYTLVFKMKNMGIGAEGGASMDYYVYDADGNQVASFTNQSMRNFAENTSNTLANLRVKVTDDGSGAATLDITNASRYREAGDEIVTTLDSELLDETETKEIVLPETETKEIAISNVVNTNGVATTLDTVSTLTMLDGSNLPDGLSVVDNKIVADVTLKGADEPGTEAVYETLLTVNVAGFADAKVSYPVTLKKGYVSADLLVANYKTSVTDATGAVVTDGAEISDNLTLDAGNSKLSIEWSSSNENAISSKGVVTPGIEDEDVELTATIVSLEDSSVTKTEKFTYTVKGVGSIMTDAINSIKFESVDKKSVTNTDEEGNEVTTEEVQYVDLSAINSDFVLPVVYSNNSAVKFAWTSSDDSIKIENGRATILQKTLAPVSSKLTVTATYWKDGAPIAKTATTKDYTATVDVTKAADTLSKYIVRCDAAASANFAGLPMDGEVVSSNLLLPTKGIFGSDIEWSSSSYTVISNTGIVTRKNTRQIVDLTATISKGVSTTDSVKYVINDLIVPAIDGSVNVGGGGSTGSSNINSTSSSTGNRAPATAYKGTLMPSTSLEKGDITTAEVVSFSDLSSVAWAKEAITALYNKGIINGKSASTFAPNDDITRAEFAKIVVKAFGLEDTSATVSDFSDVSAGDWYYTAVASAYNKGIIKGYEDGRFGVNDKITRQDMAVIIYRAAQVAGKTIAPVKDAVTFDDNADIASYAAEAVATLQKGGIINGMTATTFAPTATATRAQAAQMIYGIVK